MTISVIIPTYNRPASLRRTLRALAGSAYTRDEFEVIVVDDGGSAALDGIIAEHSEMTVRLIRQKNAGPGSARNAGARVAAGSILAFTDDDCEPAAGWLGALAQALQARPGAMAGGMVTNALAGNDFAEVSQIISEHCQANLNADPGNARFFPSNNFAVSADLYRRVGQFDAEFSMCGGEDREFCDRWISHGLQLLSAKDALVRHSHQMGMRGFCRQHFNYGRGAWVFRVVKQRRGGRVPFEGWRFHIGILGASFLAAPPHRAIRLAALICVSQAAVAAGYVWEWSKMRAAPLAGVERSIHSKDAIARGDG